MAPRLPHCLECVANPKDAADVLVEQMNANRFQLQPGCLGDLPTAMLCNEFDIAEHLWNTRRFGCYGNLRVSLHPSTWDATNERFRVQVLGRCDPEKRIMHSLGEPITYCTNLADLKSKTLTELRALVTERGNSFRARTKAELMEHLAEVV